MKHPCAETCSGYKQAREEALREVERFFNEWIPDRHTARFIKHFGLSPADAPGGEEG